MLLDAEQPQELASVSEAGPAGLVVGLPFDLAPAERLTPAEAAYMAALKDPEVDDDRLAVKVGRLLDEVEAKAARVGWRPAT